MKAYSRLFKQFILRALARHRVRSAITALGISLGVGVMIAIRLANVGAIESFRAATESVSGETSIQITGAAGRFDEMLLSNLDWLRDYGQVSPVITGYAMTDTASQAKSETNLQAQLPSESRSEKNNRAEQESNRATGFPQRGEFIQVLGVDVLRDRALRQYRLVRVSENEKEPNAREFLMLLTDPRSIILTEAFARRHNLSIGSAIPLLIGSDRREFIVRGLLLDQGPARALQGNFALMDIAAAQSAFNRLGLLDRVDVKLNSRLNVELAEAEIKSKLPASLTVVQPESSYGQVEKMIAAFHFNLNALGSIALLVGLFLIYNTISISVITRREEVGTLRAIGVSRRMVLALFLGEAILLASIGTVIGLALGRLMADLAVRASATTVETFYISTAATQAMTHRALGWSEIAIAFAFALALAMVAAAVPALEASRVRPVEAMRGAERLAKGFRPSRKHLVISILLFAIGYALTRFDPINGMPVLGFAGGVAIMFGGAFLVPNALWVACRVIEPLIARMLGRFRVESRLASANLLGAIPRVSISVAALAVALSMMVAISIMIGSFRDTVVYWLDQTLAADIYARPFTRITSTDEAELAAEAVEMAKADPEVAAVDPFITQQVNYQGETVNVGAGDFNTHLRYSRVLFKSPSDARERLLETVGGDSVMVNESFALRYEKQAGDEIQLPTVEGEREFKIIAVYYDYSSTRGTVVMDRSAYMRHFPHGRPSSMSVYLRPGVDAEAVKERLMQTVGARFPVFFMTNSALRGDVMRIFDSTFAITYALELIAIIVAGLGVISTLITLILERRGEIAVLRFIGATRRQVRRMVVIEALIIGGVSQLVGIAIGLMLSLVLIYVINVQSFAWTIQFHLPIGFLIQSTLLILVATALAGLYPAAQAGRVEAVRFAREE